MRMHIDGFVDVGFPISGRWLPRDHGHLLFRALCLHVPRLRDEPDWGVHPVQGRPTGPERLQLFQHSLVQLRLPVSDLGDVLELSDRTLRVGTQHLHLGAASVYPLQPARHLRSPCTTVYGHAKPHRFEEALRHELSLLPLSQDLGVLDVHIGERRCVKTRTQSVPGFEVILGGLSSHTSLCIQTHGIGGRRHLGLGLFTPQRPPSPRG